jgi:hypothetical protein
MAKSCGLITSLAWVYACWRTGLGELLQPAKDKRTQSKTEMEYLRVLDIYNKYSINSGGIQPVILS